MRAVARRRQCDEVWRTLSVLTKPIQIGEPTANWIGDAEPIGVGETKPFEVAVRQIGGPTPGHSPCLRSIAVEGTRHPAAPDGRNPSVDHRGAEVFVAEQFLEGPDVTARLEEVHREGVAEAVARRGLGD